MIHFVVIDEVLRRVRLELAHGVGIIAWVGGHGHLVERDPKDARRQSGIVADVVRLEKGHTEGLEPKVTEALVKLMVSARGGKAQRGS